MDALCFDNRMQTLERVWSNLKVLDFSQTLSLVFVAAIFYFLNSIISRKFQSKTRQIALGDEVVRAPVSHFWGQAFESHSEHVAGFENLITCGKGFVDSLPVVRLNLTVTFLR